jgi:NAD(P) transhydrogenase subunit alpha
MRLAVLKEHTLGERRVAIVPETVKRLINKGFEVEVEAAAGANALFRDDAYLVAGATVEPNVETLYSHADLVVRIQAPNLREVKHLRPGTTLISTLDPLRNPALVHALAVRQIRAISIDLIPRTTLAQSMDVLSSQTTASGYHAVLLAAAALPRFFPMLMTAAGTIAPAKVLVLGAGVAGLQAIATARRLGAVVEAYDVRSSVKEQVQSLGARFIDIAGIEDAQTRSGYARTATSDEKQKQAETLRHHLARADVCITTALVPGCPAPRLISEDMLRGMRPGSIIVDLAAEQGGNCELCRPGETVVAHGVTIIGTLNLPSHVATDASQMYSRNLEKLILHLFKAGTSHIDLSDEIARGCLITDGGSIVHARVADTIRAKGAA